MKEAKIKCLATRYQVPSLGLVLRQGDEVFLPEGKARDSSELLLATRNGALSVEYVQRFKVKKPRSPAPPHVRMSRPNRGGMLKSPPQPEPKKSDVDTNKVARSVGNAARQAVYKENEVLQEKLGSVESELAEIKGMLAALMERGLVAPEPETSSKTSSRKRSKKKSDGDEPMFIPDNIVDKSVDIKVSSEETGGSDLDEAAAALKAAKGGTKKKRRSRKKKTSKEKSDG